MNPNELIKIVGPTANLHKYTNRHIIFIKAVFRILEENYKIMIRNSAWLLITIVDDPNSTEV